MSTKNMKVTGRCFTKLDTSLQEFNYRLTGIIQKMIYFSEKKKEILINCQVKPIFNLNTVMMQ